MVGIWGGSRQDAETPRMGLERAGELHGRDEGE
jgi:hypothetical protein